MSKRNFISPSLDAAEQLVSDLVEEHGFPEALGLIAMAKGHHPMKQYFAYSQDLGFELYATADEARAAAQKEIDAYRDCCDPEWPEEAQWIYWGKVSERSIEKEIESEQPPIGCDGYADYVLEPVEDTTHD